MERSLKTALIALVISLPSFAQTVNFNYSGRLVLTTGMPKTGTTDLVFRVYINNALSCTSTTYSGVPLSNGVFNVALSFSSADCGGTPLSTLIGDGVVNNWPMQIETISDGTTYPRQNLGATPIAVYAMNQSISDGFITQNMFKGTPACVAGQIFEFDASGNFVCRSPGGAGTVQNITAGAGLATVPPGGIVTTGTIGLDTTYVNNNFIRVDGTNNMTANMDMGGNRIVNVADPQPSPAGDMEVANRQWVTNEVTTAFGTLMNNFTVRDDATTPVTMDNSAAPASHTLNILGSGNIQTSVSGGDTINIEAVGVGTGDITDVNAGAGINVATPGGPSPTVSVDTVWSDARWVNLTGDIMTGDLDMNNHHVKNVLDPINMTDAANKQYVDIAVAGAGDIYAIDARNGLIGSSLMSGTAVVDVGQGYGVTVNPDSIDVDTTVIQNRVGMTCAAGSSIREIDINGNVTCEVDDDSGAGGDITDVNAGVGIVVASPAGPTPLVSVDLAYTDPIYLNRTGDQMNGPIDMQNNTIFNLNPVPLAINDAVTKGYVDAQVASAGDIYDVTAGNGITCTPGGAVCNTGNVTIDIGAGPGITVTGTDVRVDTAFTDARYYNITGDTLTGNLDINGNAVTNLAAPGAANHAATMGYVDGVAAGLIDNIDAGAGMTGTSLNSGTAVLNINATPGGGLQINPNDIQIAPQGVTNTMISGLASDCSAGEIIEADGAGGFTCATDDNTTYTADGSTINLAGNTFSVILAGVMDNTDPAGGDLNGVYPNPTVVALQGRDVANTAPTNGQVLKWNNALTRWEPAADDNTTYTNGAGLDLTGTTFSIAAGGVTSGMIQDGTIVGADIQDGSLTAADLGTGFIDGLGDLSNGLCADGEVFLKSGGVWTCATDTDTTYSAGAGLNLIGTTFNIDTNGVVSGMILDGEVTSADIANGTIQAADMNAGFIDATTDFANTFCADGDVVKKLAGVWTCSPDVQTIYTASTGITLVGNDFRVDTASAGWSETRYVNTAGDVMTGSLEVPQFFHSSDRRLKKNIVPYENALDTVEQFNGVRFIWRKDEVEDIGFIAQEVEAVEPVLVRDNAKGFKSVKYSNMVAIVVEAIKELAAKVDKLFEVKEDNNKNARAIASLEEQNAKLEAELAQMEAKLDEQDKKIEKILEKK